MPCGFMRGGVNFHKSIDRAGLPPQGVGSALRGNSLARSYVHARTPSLPPSRQKDLAGPCRVQRQEIYRPCAEAPTAIQTPTARASPCKGKRVVSAAFRLFECTCSALPAKRSAWQRPSPSPSRTLKTIRRVHDYHGQAGPGRGQRAHHKALAHPLRHLTQLRPPRL